MIATTTILIAALSVAQVPSLIRGTAEAANVMYRSSGPDTQYKDQVTLDQDVVDADAKLKAVKQGAVRPGYATAEKKAAADRHLNPGHKQARAVPNDPGLGMQITVDREGKQKYIFQTVQAKKRAIEKCSRDLEVAKASAASGPLLNYGLELGHKGRLAWQATIVQVISDKQAIIQLQTTYTPLGPQKTVLLRGVATAGWSDESKIELPGFYAVTATYKYATAMGSSRTVLVVEPAKPTD